ncbi:MAG: hypothetical protein ACRELE_06850, partial [Gemmatimonadales bacterium]
EIADGWRLQVMAEARKEADYAGDVPATRQVASVEVTRRVKGPVLIALRGDATHVNTRTAVTDGSSGALSSTEFRGRLALVIDNRDREYDTRKGSLLQGGVYAGSEEPSWYALASGWLPLSTKTRITARVGARMASSRTTDGIRMMPAWENAFVVGGGPESNRALPVGSETNTKMLLVSAEIRHDLLTFPFAGVTLIGFVDGGRAYCDCDTLEDLSGVRSAPIGWTFGPGAGVAVRLLRSAVLTATVARTEHATRVYVSSGWSW